MVVHVYISITFTGVQDYAAITSCCNQMSLCILVEVVIQSKASAIAVT